MKMQKYVRIKFSADESTTSRIGALTVAFEPNSEILANTMGTQADHTVPA